MQRRLAELDSARKQFIANASHELRTPIFSLGGFVELLEEEDPSPEERAEFVRTMRQQIERLTKLTVDLLDLSQLDAGAMVMQARSVDLGALAREVTREFGARAELRGSRLELRTPERPAIAQGDPDRVRQIIRILLDNALTHTPEGTKVTVTTYSANRRAELTVSDEGSGIPQRVQSRIFERFYTADKAGGSGLGLAIASELAQRMDGRDHDQLQPPLHRLHAGPAAGPVDTERPAPPAASPRRRREGAARRWRRCSLCLAPARRLRLRRRRTRATGDDRRRGQPKRPTAGDRRDRRQRLRRGQGLPRGLARRGHDPLDLRRRGGAAEGSGFVLNTDGEIVTNAHVVTDESSGKRVPAKEVFVEFPDRNVVAAEDPRLRPLRRRRPAQGRARRLRPCTRSSSATTPTSQVGQPVAAIGSPFGESSSLSVGSSRPPTAR